MAESPQAHLYIYSAKITGVYDGDTVTADIDLGLGIWKHGEKLRLARIDAPEVRGDERPDGIRSRDFLRAKVLSKEVRIQTIKDRKGKYGRYVAEIWLDDTNLNDLMVEDGFAEFAQY